MTIHLRLHDCKAVKNQNPCMKKHTGILVISTYKNIVDFKVLRYL